MPFLNIFPVSATSSDWSEPRPSRYKVFNQTIGRAYDDGIAAVSMGVTIHDYMESNESGLNYDRLYLRVSVSANTRKGIYYNCMQYGYSWYEVFNQTNITGDNAGNWLNIPPELGAFISYGVEYTSVWVCSNGFICLDSEYTNATPSSIPDANKPNTIIAPFWRDLNPSAGSSITYGLIYGTPNLFVISWNNVPNKANGVPQTFQLVIRGSVGGADAFHNALLFQYKSITKDQLTTVGVEDQIGSKGTSLDPNSLGNNYCLLFQYSIMGYRLEHLTIRLTKIDTYAIINPQLSDVDIGGYNIILESYTNPCGEVFGAAIGLAADLLLPYKAGIMFGTLLIIPTLGNYFSGQLSRPDFQYDWADTNENEAYVSAACAEEDKTWLMPFDATLADIFVWGLTDNNNRNHLLTVTAESTYKSMDDLSTHTISTSVTLYMYAVTPSTPDGPTYGYVGSIYSYSTSITDPEEDPVRYEFSWGDGTPNTITDWYASGVNATASHSWASSGTYQVRVRAQDIYESWSGVWGGWSSPLNVTIVNRYYLTVKTYIGTIELTNLKVWIDSIQYCSPATVLVVEGTHTVEAQTGYLSGSYVYVFYHWEDGSTNNPRSVTVTSDRVVKAYYKLAGTCPTLFVWNGSEYISETLLNIHAESDITVQHQIQQTLALDGRHYKLQLRELDNFTSHIDQVKLYAVDHNGEWHLCSLSYAKLNNTYVTLKLLFDDDKRVDLTPSENIDLKFLPSIPYNETAYFIFEINGYNKKVP